MLEGILCSYLINPSHTLIEEMVHCTQQNLTHMQIKLRLQGIPEKGLFVVQLGQGVREASQPQNNNFYHNQTKPHSTTVKAVKFEPNKPQQ